MERFVPVVIPMLPAFRFYYVPTWASDNHKRNVEYLGRYIKRPPISEARIDEYDGEKVTFRFLDHYNNTIERIKMPVMNFIARLIRHIPDRNFKMIRYP